MTERIIPADSDTLTGTPVRQLLYGENAWQSPAIHCHDTDAADDPLALDRFEVLVGEPGFNTLGDLDRLLQTMTHIAAAWDVNFGAVPKIAIAVKHGNACGAGVESTGSNVIDHMVDGDRRAIMGGLVMVNFPLDEYWAERLLTHGMPTKPNSPDRMRRLIDGVIAPSVSGEAIASMKRKGDKCRIFTNPALAHLTRSSLDTAPLRRQVRGGYLLQPNYTFVLDLAQATGLLPGQPAPELTRMQKADLLLAWAICATSTSNTITIANNCALCGNGVGQQDRVGAAELAIKRARDSRKQYQIDDGLAHAVAASDSFFPFPDGMETLAAAGIEAIFTTSGSIHDKDVAARAAELGVKILALPDKAARSFFNH